MSDLKKFPGFNFNHSDVPGNTLNVSAADTKQKFDSRGVDLKEYLDKLIDILNSLQGANSISAKDFDNTKKTIQQLLNKLNTNIVENKQFTDKEIVSLEKQFIKLNETFEQLIINAGDSNAEIVSARVDGKTGASYPTIGKRIDDVNFNLGNLGSDLDENTKNIVNLALYKGNNIYEQLESALKDIKTMQSYESMLNRNVTIKIPSGTYYLDKQFLSTIEPRNIEFDFTNCIFIANTKDFSFAEMVLYRTRIIGGSWSGFKDTWKIRTNNVDNAKIKFVDNQFSLCDTCIDLVGYNESRSTILTIDNIMSLNNKTLLKSYTDMCVINGGWINSVNSESTIYNMSNLEINDVTFTPHTPSKQSAWIENHESPDGGDRSLSLNHCRFGAENGGKDYIVKNYANNQWFNRQPTRIKIDNCMLYGKYAVYCVKIPNQIVIENSNGNGVNYLVGKDKTLDLSGLSSSNVNIVFSNIPCYNSRENNQEYFDDDEFYSFLVGNEYGYTKDLLFNLPIVGNKAIFHLPLREYPSTDGGTGYCNSLKKHVYLVSVGGYVEGNEAYGVSALYVLSLSGSVNSFGVGTLKAVCNLQKIYSGKAGVNGDKEIELIATFNETDKPYISPNIVNKDTYVKLSANVSGLSISVKALSKSDRYCIF